MSLQLQISTSLEERMRQTAIRNGVDVSQFAVQFLESSFPETQAKPKSISNRESVLLQHIESIIPISTWERYRLLRTKLQSQSINAAENEEYGAIIKQIEEANVKRLASLIELAKIRKTNLVDVMKQLGLKSDTNE